MASARLLEHPSISFPHHVVLVEEEPVSYLENVLQMLPFLGGNDQGNCGSPPQPGVFGTGPGLELLDGLRVNNLNRERTGNSKTEKYRICSMPAKRYGSILTVFYFYLCTVI
jgi:hypothetical protein